MFVGLICLVIKRPVLFVGYCGVFGLFWWGVDWFLLFWVGGLPVVFPFDSVGLVVCVLFFVGFLV